ncbi:MAG: chemotaxis protein CheD [Myxococcales bacterium]
MTRVVAVGLAELKVSDDPEVELTSYALGSCIALMLHDPARRLAGMLHYMLPTSSTNPAKAREQPGMFADVGIPLLLAQMQERGSRRGTLVVKAAGGAKCYEDHGAFDIGERNQVILRKLLWRAGLMLSGADLGGTRSRTVRLSVATGAVVVRSGTEEWSL